MSDEHLRRAAEACYYAILDKAFHKDFPWDQAENARQRMIAAMVAAEPHFRALHAKEMGESQDRQRLPSRPSQGMNKRLSPHAQAKAHCDALELLTKRPEITLEDLALIAAQLNRVSDVVLRRTEAVVDIEPQPRREPSYRRPNAAPQSAVREQRLKGPENALAAMRSEPHPSAGERDEVVCAHPNGMSGTRYHVRKAFGIDRRPRWWEFWR
ncbi:MAG: hypothetical protein GF393_08695 [Armatimonadia bacterium]|nr:hypothetical protein [Armatimonadia bacterium]